jgi:hypothetical protein
MKYLLLFSNPTERWDEWRRLSADEVQRRREEVLPQWNTLFEWMGEQGLDADGLELEDPAKARVVQVQDGNTIVTDGPFLETKEVLGGYFVVDCKDLDEAIELAQRVPVASVGSVEIRPVVEN